MGSANVVRESAAGRYAGGTQPNRVTFSNEPVAFGSIRTFMSGAPGHSCPHVKVHGLLLTSTFFLVFTVSGWCSSEEESLSKSFKSATLLVAVPAAATAEASLFTGDSTLTDLHGLVPATSVAAFLLPV